MEGLSSLLAYLKQDKKAEYSILKKEEFDIIPWLESKIQNRPLIDLVKESRRKSKL